MGGIAIWCMHFIGNRAIDLADGEPELQIAYSSGFTALSFFVPIAVLLAAFVAVGINNTVSWWRVCVGGVLAGAAICGMHYLGNNSIDNYVCIYNPVNVVGAALIAVAASIVALALFFVFRAAWTTSWWKRAACSVVLAGAVSGMHWCAATGTEYQLVRLNTGSNELSRNTTVIVVICLSIGACFVMGGTAIYTARIMRRYASKAQQVVLAAAVFDKHNRILVNPDGLVPTEKITDTFLEKNASDTFSIAHPLFLWMFQASRNWSGISTLVGGMANHLAHLPRRGRDRDTRAGIQLINEHGELIENYDVIFRELFCVAAAGLAEKMKEHLTSVGLLWDEILPTGASGERPGHEKEVPVLRPDGTVRKVEATSNSVDLAEKGVGRRRHHEFGRGSLMFLVRRVQTDREIERLEAAGYRFAELRQVSNIIGTSMQIKSADLESKLQNMAAYVSDNNQLEPGVHLGFFGIRARVGSYGFDVAVRRGARNLLPSVQMPLDRIEQWHLDFLRQLDRLTALGMSRRMASLSNVGTREAHFAAQLTDSLDALRAWIDDPIFNDAILTSTVVTLPPSQAADEDSSLPPTSLIVFRLVIPIHVNFTSPKCEFIPLNFFKVHQLVGREASRHLAFTQSVHRELAPVLQSVPLEKPSPAMHSRRQSRISSRILRFGKPSPAHPVDSEGNPIPTVLGRSSSRSGSNESSSTLKLWSGRRDSEGMSPGTLSFETAPPAYTNHEAGNQSSAFGGIMVSEEIRVEVSNADDTAAQEVNPSHRRTPTMMDRRASEHPGSMPGGMGVEPAGAERHNGRSNSTSSGAIEMRTLQVAEVRTNVHAGRGTQGSNAGADRVNDATTFVDELFTIAIGSR
ncbi:single-stranded DNA-binding protein RIM1, mitochondrial [Colletotrichum spaethianum]|uniref:Single-stranded DNA-binding protein RIM1, mitochondrial n=1 Tax=Colletotrichum spaethianum TaxID=700344 RepID=A0AA37UQT7_9PEZI|nr:single-stranded DNA-binding protein RIM1, mitochondrial [Colletotrichum spaethianum]GKT49427.1 single-stranded DNA-binding protein RIM1, mitochondrial [Colletotrichum spaethianum]